MYTLVSLAGIDLLTLASHDSKVLTEGVVLQSGSSIVRCIERLILARVKKMKGLNAIDRSLQNRNEIFFEVGTGTHIGAAVAIGGLRRPLTATMRSIRREGGASTVGSIAIAVVE